MDTLGFYSRENILSRVKLLEKYPDLMAVGTDKLGYYDIIHKNSYSNRVKNELFISSLGFRKKLWEERNFSEGSFFEGRVDSFINIPHTFIQYGIILGRDDNKKNVGQQLFSYYDTWDIIDQEFMDNLGGYLKRKNKFDEINRQVIN